MRRGASVLVACIVLLGAQVAPVRAPMSPSEHPPQLSSVDDAFAVAATQGNAAELAFAKLALVHSESGDVRGFAKTMLTEHQEIGMEGTRPIRRHLPRAAARFGAPDMLAIAYLQNLPPVDFDQQYAMLQIGDHLATQTAFATEARDGRDPALKAFAQKWLPTIQAHLQLAVALVKHVGGDTPFKN